ncbi:hypothetical protein FPOA_06845 [Fusarium poae]|uniref:Apple domain-containing protein n=1 Tax=Fusarium poae TaxID=36050 RepID=A0A1B8AJ42_FUSPO|nr:hypothetical protein FPOA_06845 [Fusarium poae]
MLPFKAVITLLWFGAVSAFPASQGLDKRATVCKIGDRNLLALKSHKADGSAFCSTYLQTTKTSTITPVASATTTKWMTRSVRLVVIQKVHFIVKHISRIKVMRTASTTITKTKTISVTDVGTKKVTGTRTDKIMNTDTAQVTKTGTAQITKRVTRHFTITATATVYTTSTRDVTRTSTMQLTEEAPTTITVTEEAATTIVPVPYICGARGLWTRQYIISSGDSSSDFGSFSLCKAFCSTKPGAMSFAYGLGGCICFSALTYVHLSRIPDYDIFLSDLACPAETKPLKRAAQVNKRIPAYLPLKGASDVSRACSCHITNRPAAPATSTVKALNAKLVTTTTKTGYNTVTITNRQSATVTQPVTVTVTHVKTVTVTHVNSVQVTNHNTIYTTNINTALETDLQTEIVTEVDIYTVTEHETIPVTVTKAEVIEPPLVTVYVATTTIYG